MELIIEQIIKEKLKSLVNFIVEKYPHTNKNRIYHKIYQLGMLVPSGLTSLRESALPNNIKPPIAKQSIIQSITEQIPVIKVEKSQHSNYILKPSNASFQNKKSTHFAYTDNLFEDLVENNFVINIASKVIIGIENSKGEIEPLNKYLIEICHKYKLKYELPLNLNINNEESEDIITDKIYELGLNYEKSDSEEEEESVNNV